MMNPTSQFKVVAKGTAIVAAEPLALEPEVRLKAMK